MRERFGSRLHLLVVAREEHTHVGADTGGHVEPCHRLFRSLGAASIGTRDDDEIFVSLIAGIAGVVDLDDELLAPDRVRDKWEDGDPHTGAKNCSIRNSFQFEVSTVLPVA